MTSSRRDGVKTQRTTTTTTTTTETTSMPTSTPTMSSSSRKKDNQEKNHCGHCKEECSITKDIPCGFCQTFFHPKCIDGMSPEWIKVIDGMNRLSGASGYLCVCCIKLTQKINRSFVEYDKKFAEYDERIKDVEMENKVLKEKVLRLEGKTEEASDGLVRMEKELESGMEKAKNEVKEDVSNEMKEQEERNANVVIYGVEESKEEREEKRKEGDEKVVRELAAAIGVDDVGRMERKFRAGKKDETTGKPRPMVVRIEDPEVRERILDNARKLNRTDSWKRVFISRDLTWKQREDAKKQEKQLRDEADQKNEAEKDEEKNGKWIVVGPRGRRRMAWAKERGSD